MKWLYSPPQEEGGALVLRHLGVAVALTLLLCPWSARAQDVECTMEDGCDTGGPCPLRNLPYEEFIATPPTDRGGRNIPPVSERPFDPESGDRILVRGFVVDGVTPNPKLGVTSETVQAAANAAFAREAGGASEARMTVGHMVRVADAVTTFYRSSGYIVARGFLPVQTIGPDSIVHIQVMEGKIAEVVVEGAKKYKPATLRKPSEGLVGTVPTRDAVETALLYTQDYPGVRLFGTFRPGNAAGETKLVLQVLEEDTFDYAFGADNYGTEFTGEYRFRADIAWNNPIGWGDQLNLALLQSVAPENTTYGSLGYRVPVGPRGFGIGLGASQNAFVVNEEPFDDLQLEGTITSYSAGVDWRYERGRFDNARIGLNYITKMSELTARGTLQITDDQFSTLELESNMDRIDVRFKGVDQVTAKIRQGVSGDFGSSAGVDENFTILEARYSRVQALADTQTAIIRLKGQATDTELSPLEQFALAGPDAVRAYPVGQILRDTGQFASLEYQVQAPGFARAPGPFTRQWGDLLQLALFADYAHGRNAESTSDDELSGYGAGIHFGVPGSFTLVIEGAKPISAREASDGKELRFYGNLTVKF
jgi:hemolysin activation/secretion protein